MPRIISIDTAGLTQAVSTALQYSGRVPPIACGTAGFYVARKASNTIKRADISGIDQSLGLIVPALTVTRGPRKGLPYKRRPKPVVPTKSLAMWIVLARMKPGSKVNQRENNRYLLDRASFSPGGGVEGFWSAVKAYAVRMVSLRHKSIAFIASSMLPIIRDLEQYVPPQYRRGMPPRNAEAEQAGQLSLVPKGDATVQTGANTAVITGRALIGVAGQPDNLNEEHNKALWQWAAPAIQLAVYDEQGKQLTYAAIRGELEAKRTTLAASGVRLS